MLTDEQLQQIEDYVAAGGVLYYDVRLEIADHLTEQVIASIQKDGLAFEVALQQQGAIFRKDWAAIVHGSAKYLRKKLLRMAVREIMSYFSWPRITVTVAVMALLMWLDSHHTLNVRDFPLLSLQVLLLLVIFYNRAERRRAFQKITGISRQMRGLGTSERKAMAKTVKEKSISLRLLTGRQLMKISVYFSAVEVLYVLLVVIFEASGKNMTMGRVLLYSFPLVLIVKFAWARACAGVRKTIHENYPEFI